MTEAIVESIPLFFVFLFYLVIAVGESRQGEMEDAAEGIELSKAKADQKEVLKARSRSRRRARRRGERSWEPHTVLGVRRRFCAVQEAYANAVSFAGPQREYIFTAPAILDSSAPATADFLDALEFASKSMSSIPRRKGPHSLAPLSVVDAVDRAEGLWERAVEMAQREVRSGGFER